jgi:hypothetical protein
MDGRIDGVDEGGSRVFLTTEVGRDLNVPSIVRMSAMSNVKLPLRKFTLQRIISVQAHVVGELKDLDVSPEDGALDTGTDSLST